MEEFIESKIISGKLNIYYNFSKETEFWKCIRESDIKIELNYFI